MSDQAPPVETRAAPLARELPRQGESAEAPAAQAKPAEAKTKAAAAQTKEAAQKAGAAGSPLDISTRFSVDAQTQALTVTVVNQRTREVIRTIPPEEQSRLKPGDLLNLFA